MNTINSKELHTILQGVWQHEPGPKKYIFKWNRLPATVKLLAGTDSSGLVEFEGVKYYVNYFWGTNTIVVELY